MLEVKKGQSITAFFTLKGNEEFLLDHFEGFPVMPGVLLLESVKQAASRLLEMEAASQARYRLSKAPVLKFGQFVKPGSRLKVFVEKTGGSGLGADFNGRIHLMKAAEEGPKALQASFSLEKLS